MSRIGNRLEKLAKLFNSRVGFTLDERQKVFAELKSIQEYLCCLPDCEDVDIEVIDTNNNVLLFDTIPVCTDYIINVDGCLNIMTADFTADKTTVDTLENIQFTDTTNNLPTNWYWDFGDLNTSTLQNPIHQYTAYGVYTVSLMAAKDGAGDIVIKTNFIEVVNPFGL